jgi:hypothetical protein
MRVRRLWLCVPVAVCAAADGLLTLIGQPPEYWSGGYAQVSEANPLGAWLLTVHPLAFAAACVPYLVLVGGLIVALPRRWALLVAVVVPLAHAFAAAVWCFVLLGERT